MTQATPGHQEDPGHQTDPGHLERPRRGRPRDATIDTRVLAAAVDELAGHGVGGFSVNRVAARAGVAKRGIYMRWPDRDDLVVDALGTLAAGLVPPRTGRLGTDLLRLAPYVDAVFTEPRLSVLARCMAELPRFPAMYAAFRRESVDRCSAAIEDAFQDAVSRGEARADLDTDLATSVFLGALLARHAFSTRQPAPASEPAPAGAPSPVAPSLVAPSPAASYVAAPSAVGDPDQDGHLAFHRRLVDFCLAAVREGAARTLPD